jgi:hypothetical protein
MQQRIIQDFSFLMIAQFLKNFAFQGRKERQVSRKDVETIHKIPNTGVITYP